MNKVERYKKMYGETPRQEDQASGSIRLSPDQGNSVKVDIDPWLAMLLLHSSGIKSKKKRIVKKVLKREIQRLISQQSKDEQ